jgi:hypothetical protein
MTRRSLGLPSALWLVAVLAVGQDHPAGSQQASAKEPSAQAKVVKKVDAHLARIEAITAPAEMATAFQAPLKCDSDGNFYFQSNPTTPAIHKLNSKGEEIALFRPTSNPDFKVDAAIYFAIAPGGDLYQLVFPHEIKRYVFAYKSDGTFRSAIKLDPGFPWSPRALAIFASGHLLVAGSEYDKDRTAAMWPFTGIFAADGSLLKEVKLEDDDTLHDMAVAGDARVSAPQAPNDNRAVSFSQLETAADGNAYLMRWTNPAVFYAISAGGEVLRRFAVDPGGLDYWPAAMHLFQNRIAVLFVDEQTHDKIMKIVDLEGHDIAAYDELRANGKPVHGLLGTAFACYTENPTRFVFLGSSDDNKLQLWIAEPR